MIHKTLPADYESRRDVIVLINRERECYDLIDLANPLDHDGDNAHQLVARVYDEMDAEDICLFLNARNRELDQDVLSALKGGDDETD